VYFSLVLRAQSCAVKVNPFFNTLKASAQSVVVDLIFNLGCSGYSTFTGFANFLRNKVRIGLVGLVLTRASTVHLP
jgi:hypothetical protein